MATAPGVIDPSRPPDTLVPSPFEPGVAPTEPGTTLVPPLPALPEAGPKELPVLVSAPSRARLVGCGVQAERTAPDSQAIQTRVATRKRARWEADMRGSPAVARSTSGTRGASARQRREPSLDTPSAWHPRR